MDTDRISGLGSFLVGWDRAPDAPAPRPVALRASAFGNVNPRGHAGDDRGDSIPRSHPRFRDAIEPGIRELVFELVDRWGLMTYTSCEGHAYAGTSLPPTLRTVSLLPRNETEARLLRDRFINAAVETNLGVSREPVCVALRRGVLRGEGEARLRVARLVLAPRRDMQGYFERVDAVYDRLLIALRRWRP